MRKLKKIQRVNVYRIIHFNWRDIFNYTSKLDFKDYFINKDVSNDFFVAGHHASLTEFENIYKELFK